jgi:hypothetical protein
LTPETGSKMSSLPACAFSDIAHDV